MRPSPFVRGSLWAIAASVAFGVTIPAIALVRATTGTWSTAAALYAGAALFAATIVGSPQAALTTLRRHGARYAAIALLGGALAPAAFIAGLRLAGPLGSSLALNAEILFSIAFAAVVFREHVSAALIRAAAAILAGALLLVVTSERGVGSTFGIGLVVFATALWAADNVISASLGGADPRTTVLWKAAFGALLSAVVAIILREPIPAFGPALGLLVVGAIGYGASLWSYLIAQRTFGVARAASIFAIAPFVGALVSIGLHPVVPQVTTIVAGALMVLGVALHVSERHAHRHRHLPIEHEHVHHHDDGHHEHPTHEPIDGEHAHAHRHDDVDHEHAHAPDVHHRHDHDCEPRSAAERP